MTAFTSTILITGGTTGLGYWSAYELARQSPKSKVIICSRSDKDNAASNLNRLLQKQHAMSGTSSIMQVEYLPLDLSSTSNIRSFVKAYSSKSYPSITSLLLNAGLQFHSGQDLRLSPDGIETTFAVNHVGHALLLFLLKPQLASNARIVITSSGTHDPAQKTMVPDAQYQTAELLAHPTDNKGYNKQKGLQRYSSSKLANVLFTYALERRLRSSRAAKSTGMTVVVMDPGLMPGTSLGRDFGPVVMWIAKHVMTQLVWLMRLLLSPNVHLPQDSGRNLAGLAREVGEQALMTSGKYYEGSREIQSSKDSHDEQKQEDLWQWTVDFLAKDEEEKMMFQSF